MIERSQKASYGWIIAGLFAILPGCSTGFSSDSSSPDAEKSAQNAASLSLGSSSPAAQPRVAAPTRAAVTIRPSGGEVEILVESPEGFPRRAHDPVLQIGDAKFTRYRYADRNSVFALVYTLSSEEFAALADGAPIVVGNGRARSVATAIGSLNKASIVSAPKGAVSP